MLQWELIYRAVAHKLSLFTESLLSNGSMDEVQRIIRLLAYQVVMVDGGEEGGGKGVEEAQATRRLSGEDYHALSVLRQ